MKTAVQWLYNQQMKHPLGDWDYFLKQAKEMEKQQIVEGIRFFKYRPYEEITAEQYYDETFNKSTL
jgi:hypothetical protein